MMKRPSIHINALIGRSSQQLLLLGFGIWVLVIGTDLLDAHWRNYSFYLSESLLFGSYWLYFIPILLMVQKKKSSLRQIRLVLPLVLLIFHHLLFSTLVLVISGLFFYSPFGFSFVWMKSLIDYSIPGITIYTLATFLFHYQPLDLKRNLQNRPLIRIKNGNKLVLIKIEEIHYVTIERPYVRITSKKGIHLYHSSLKSFKKQYLDEQFIQIHKGTIIHPDHIKCATSRGNGDYDLTMNDDVQLRVSRNFNQYFRLRHSGYHNIHSGK
jgi:hypothetical protein